MLSEIELEALRYFDREALERLQILARYLRDVVDRHARKLALRYIHDVNLENGVVFIQLLEETYELIKVAAPGELDLQTLFHRVNNAFVRRLDLSFQREDLLLPFYLRENSSRLQCRIEMLGIAHEEHKPAPIDYALVGFLVRHFEPKTYESMMIGGLREDYATLFAHNTMRGIGCHAICNLTVDPAPDCILPELFGVDVIQTCAIATIVDPRQWIAKFIGMFEAAERGKDVVPSVTLLHERPNNSAPLRHTADPLGRPRHTEVPAPQSAYIKEWVRKMPFYGRPFTESTVSNLYVFENAKAAKKLEISEWTLEEVRNGVLTSVYYAFLLKVVNM
ncbi:hypothetical protein AAVH_25970 [Aphelenchoides avenae]|nr:hypothetical protein AAVH_25970 [Aphelenchus avenae]